MFLNKKLAALAIVLPLFSAGNVFAVDAVKDEPVKQVKAEKEVKSTSKSKSSLYKHPERVLFMRARQCCSYSPLRRILDDQGNTIDVIGGETSCGPCN